MRSAGRTGPEASDPTQMVVCFDAMLSQPARSASCRGGILGRTGATFETFSRERSDIILLEFSSERGNRAAVNQATLSRNGGDMMFIATWARDYSSK